MIGTRLSHFEITAKLGEGGMGTVYRGRDTKLGREVAIKVLPELFTADPERLARFEREAKVLASLNHPSIAGIFEVGSAVPAEQGSASGRDDIEAVHYIVMELAEGEDLTERVARGPMTLDEALPIARQIAEALEAAHKSGVIHRDLKPANVKLTPDGRVKVLDFGLAKALDTGMGGAFQGDLSHSPTLTAQMTSAGMILGTAAYMSPEQAKGEEADKRADIWSFGIVLWEMLVGQKTFAEKTVSETLAAVLKSDPDHSVLPATVPLSIRRLIERCLQKDPEQRLHDIADARLEIEAVLRGDDSAAMIAGATVPAGDSRFWKGIAAGASLVAVLAAASHFLPSDEAQIRDPQPIRFVVDRPPFYITGEGPSLAVSPDGRRIAYRGINPDGSTQIFLRNLDSVEAEPISGTENALGPFFSPDGSRIGFTNANRIFSVALHGGAPSQLAEIQNYRGAAWADDGTIFFGPDTEAGLWRMNEDGSDARRITVPDATRGERSHRFPAVLPGSDVVLFSVGTAEISVWDEARIDALRISTGERKTVVDGGMFPLFLAPDILLYSFSGTLMAARFDAETLELTGSPTPVLDNLKSLPFSGVSSVAVSSDGSLIAGYGPPVTMERQLMVYDRNGRSEPLSAEARAYQALALSPDGTTLAVDIDAANASIWLLDLERDIQTRLTTRWSHTNPVWSPDGSELVSSTASGGTYQVYRHHLDQGTSEVIYESTDHQVFVSSWSVDGRLASLVIPKGRSFDIWLHPADDPSRAEPLIAGPYAEWGARFSPDGRWLAFVSDESGQPEAYILSAAGTGAKIRVSSNGAASVAWSHAGDELFFNDGTTFFGAPVKLGERLRVGRPQRLFQPAPFFDYGVGGFDVTRDGRFFLIQAESDPAQTTADLIFTRHWIDELESLLR